MKKAKSGELTYAEYYNLIKENLLETFPGIENYPDDRKAKIAELVNGLTPEQVERLQDRILALPSPESSDYNEKLKEFKRIFLQESSVTVTDTIQNGDEINHSSTKIKAKEPYVPYNGPQKMSFSEVFERRMGVEYSRENVQRFQELNSRFAVQKSVEQAKNSIHNLIDNANSDDEISQAVKKLLFKFLASQDDKELSKLLKNLSEMDGVKVKNGEISCKNMSELKEKLLENIDKRAYAVNGGKSIEELSNEYERAYKNAYGSKNVELLAEAYAKDQSDFVKNARRAVEYTGTAASLIGMTCCPPLAIGAGLVGSMGGIGIELWDESTKDNVSKKRVEELKKELCLNSTLFVAGMGSGMLGSAAGAAASVLTTKCPKLVAFVAEHGVDATASLVSTMALTGELDLSAEGVNQLISVLSGLKTSKVGIKNAQYDANLGIAYNPEPNRGFFGRLLHSARGGADLEPGNWLNRYKPSKSRYGNLSHRDFYEKNPHLFAGNYVNDYWSEMPAADKRHGPWKMHLFSVSEEDWQKMADVIIPYLRERGVEWKTLNIGRTCEADLNGSRQQGKAFTIYPRNNDDFEQIARDLDYIIRNNNLQIGDSHITGDRQMGSTGRIFYRYEFNTGAMKNRVLDLNNPQDKQLYHAHYDANRGEGNYLARDMSPSDDIWLNFDPSNPSSKPSSGQNMNFSYRRIDRQGRLQPDTMYALGNVRSIRVADVDIDLYDPYIMNMLNNMPDGSYIKVGRSSSCQIRIRPECDAVSRAHLIIYKIKGQIFIRDISTNGTYIN